MVHLLLCASLAYAARSSSQTVMAGKPFYALVERLAIAETQIQTDHFKAVASKRPRAQRKRLLDDLSECQTVVKDFVSSYPATTTSAGALQSSLEQLTANENALSSYLEQHLDANESREDGRLWSAHLVAFHKVISSCWKFPHFSDRELNPAVYYNITPRLHEDAEFPVLADPTHPDEARIGETLAENNPKLKRGDVIVAYWMPEDKKWVEVKTWRDLIAAPIDAIDEDSHLLRLKVNRRGREVEESVSFLPVYHDVD